MGFMQPQIRFDRWYKIEADGVWFVPAADVGPVKSIDDLRDYCEGKVEGYEIVEGWGARLSAPGYLDRTDWCVLGSREEAEAYLREMYDEESEEEEEEAEEEEEEEEEEDD